MKLLKYLESIIMVSENLKQEIITITENKRVKKNDIIINIGERCGDLFFIEKGLLRGYYLNDGKEITNWFAQEGEFATCFYSFISQKQSFETIQALEDMELVRIPYLALQSLYINYPEMERLGRIITENYYIKFEERFLSLQFKSAKERYQNLLESKSTLLQRASLGQIATYLGISQDTLSRMRSDL